MVSEPEEPPLSRTEKRIAMRRWQRDPVGPRPSSIWNLSASEIEERLSEEPATKRARLTPASSLPASSRQRPSSSELQAEAAYLVPYHVAMDRQRHEQRKAEWQQHQRPLFAQVPAFDEAESATTHKGTAHNAGAKRRPEPAGEAKPGAGPGAASTEATSFGTEPGQGGERGALRGRNASTC